MDQVRNSLDIDTDKPVSRQHEGEFLNYYIVNTSSWWLGHQVLIAPQSIKGVSWFDDMVSINLTREQMKNAPHYYPATP